MAIRQRATIEDLYHVPEHGKAELVNGELVLMSPTGASPGYAGDEIFVALRAYTRQRGHGRAVSDNKYSSKIKFRFLPATRPRSSGS